MHNKRQVLLMGIGAIALGVVVLGALWVRTHGAPTLPPTTTTFVSGGTPPTYTTDTATPTTSWRIAHTGDDHETLYGGYAWNVASTTTGAPYTTDSSDTAAPSDIGALFRALIGPTVSGLLSSPSQSTDEPLPQLVGGMYDNTTEYTPGTATNDTATQAALRAYANELATHLDAFLLRVGDEVAVFNAFFADRSDADAMRELGVAYGALAEQIATLTAPAPLSYAHDMFVTGYAQVGEHVLLMIDAATDEAFLEAVQAYNEQPGTVVQAILRMSDTLSAYGVHFTAGEPGGMFEFSSPY